MTIGRSLRGITGALLAAPVLVGSLAGSSGAATHVASLQPHKPNPITLSGLSSELATEEKATFKAVYVDYESSSSKSTITFEQKSPDSLVSISGGLMLTLGSKSYYCSSDNSHATCIEETSSPFASMVDLFNPAFIITELKGFQEEVALKVAGVSVSSSTKSIAGKTDECETVKVKTGSSTWCVTSNGFLAYAGGSTGSYLELQSYSTSVSSSDFALPKGATITAMP